METITILTIPASLKNNPYLELLYGQINNQHEENVNFKVKPFHTRTLLVRIFSGKCTVHIHWETNIYGSKSRTYSFIKIITRFPLLFLAKVFGTRFVWTMHNLRAHDYPFKNLDAYGRSLMRKLANVIIIQNKEASIDFEKKYPHSRVEYIPHGNYVDAYGPSLKDKKDVRARMRTELQLPEEGTVLLALGAIRPYKHLEVLIDVVRNTTDITILIAGKGESDYIASLKTVAQNNPAVRILPEFIANSRIPEFFAVADYAIFAHGESALTSGALLLALSYGTPVITLPMPAAEIIKEGVNGFVPQSIEVLRKLLERLPSMPVPNPRAVTSTVSEFSWEYVGKKTRELYATVYTGKIKS